MYKMWRVPCSLYGKRQEQGPSSPWLQTQFVVSTFPCSLPPTPPAGEFMLCWWCSDSAQTLLGFSQKAERPGAQVSPGRTSVGRWCGQAPSWSALRRPQMCVNAEACSLAWGWRTSRRVSSTHCPQEPLDGCFCAGPRRRWVRAPWPFT